MRSRRRSDGLARGGADGATHTIGVEADGHEGMR